MDTIPSFARAPIRKHSLKSFSFQERSTTTGKETSKDRCLVWKPVTTMPRSLKYNQNDEPYFRITVEAETMGNCPMTFSPATDAVYTPPTKSNNIATLEVTVRPPLTIIRAQGPNFKDELVFDAPIEKIQDISFFDFFKKSNVNFDSRYTKISTNNPNFDNYTTQILPIFGGAITVPFPWLQEIQVGYSMYQNLGNLLGNTRPVQYSEFSFDLRYVWLGPDSWGLPKITPLIDYRGRNIYQTINDASERPFIIGSLSLVGVGSEFAWFFGRTLAAESSFISKFGIHASGRYYFNGKISNQKSTSYNWESALMYQLSEKWSLGAGYSRTHQTVELSAENAGGNPFTIQEKVSNIFLRLSLFPFDRGQ